jgi:hypothetical protein
LDGGDSVAIQMRRRRGKLLMAEKKGILIRRLVGRSAEI